MITNKNDGGSKNITVFNIWMNLLGKVVLDKTKLEVEVNKMLEILLYITLTFHVFT